MIFIKTIVTTILLSSFAASAAPPDPVLPTGACAGLLKKTSVVTYTDADSAAGRIGPDNVPYLHFYLDFDNGLADIGFMDERNRLGSDEEDVQRRRQCHGRPRQAHCGMFGWAPPTRACSS